MSTMTIYEALRITLIISLEANEGKDLSPTDEEITDAADILYDFGGGSMRRNIEDATTEVALLN